MYGDFWNCIQCGWMRDLPRDDQVQKWRRMAESDGVGLTMSPASECSDALTTGSV
ncbi:MAG: hypothetical protein IIB17_04095 [Chloroflexi bacterium]|nr:hypothetical protein [Chloroflexota bacterium]